MVDDINGTVGDIKLGMTAVKLIALLGQPDEKRDAAATLGACSGAGASPGSVAWNCPRSALICENFPTAL